MPFKFSSKKLDSYLRFLDFYVQRMDAGTRFEQAFDIRRHTLMSYLWPPLVCTAVLTGMPGATWTRLAVSIALAVGSWFLFLWVARFTRDREVRWDAYVQAGLVLACCAAVALFGRGKDAESGVYLHLLTPIAAIVAGSILIAAAVTRWCFRKVVRNSKYPEYIAQTELFQRRPEVEESAEWRWLQAAIMPVFNPPRLILFPCLGALVAVPGWEWTVAGPLLAGCWLILFETELNERPGVIVQQVTNRFLSNGALAISILAIGLGVGRLAGVSYVTTVLDTAARLQVAAFLAFAYAIVWWHDDWLERLAGQEMLRIAGGDEKRPGVPYVPTPGLELADVPADSRTLQLHGIGRFVILRPDTFFRKKFSSPPPAWVGDPFPAFHTWSFTDLFFHVASRARPAGDASPAPERIQTRLRQHLVLARVLTAAALAVGAYALHVGDQTASAKVTAQTPGQKRLSRIMSDHPAGRPLVLVAASGGGARAALFTAAVLEGVSHHAAANDIALGSGVSGGGAALAYFAARQDQMNWDLFFTAMGKPFIRDVLDRASEWRIIAGQRLGVLLDESFDRHWGLPRDRKKLGDIPRMGLILNTTIAGHGSANSPEYRADLAGGRLIFTNLVTAGAFEGSNLQGMLPEPLPVVIRDGELRLSTAAALNANFPPVFSNAPVDVDGIRRYWVTDGGAADNRGAEMLLYVLRQALREAPELRQRRILVLIADASAAPDAFNPGDRGLGGAIGAGAQFAMHLNAELVRSLDAPNVRVAYLPMPKMLRESGSFGTHWMVQESIDVRHGGQKATVSGADVTRLLRHLYAGRNEAFDGAAEQVRGWIHDAPEYTVQWCGVRDWLRESVGYY